MLRATTACIFSTSEPPKVARTCGVLCILTSKCASRHNGVHFFDIPSAKSGPDLVCFVHFDFKMCFAPQRRALFRHRNFQKWSDTKLFYTFLLQNLLRATTACNCSSLISPDDFAPAALASLLFDPPEPQIIGKTHCSVFHDVPTFSRACTFFLLSFSLLTLPTSAFQLSRLSVKSVISVISFNSLFLEILEEKRSRTTVYSFLMPNSAQFQT